MVAIPPHQRRLIIVMAIVAYAFVEDNGHYEENRGCEKCHSQTLQNLEMRLAPEVLFPLVGYPGVNRVEKAARETPSDTHHAKTNKLPYLVLAMIELPEDDQVLIVDVVHVFEIRRIADIQHQGGEEAA